MSGDVQHKLRYTFSRDHGFALVDGDNTAAKVIVREDANMRMLPEVRRAVGRPLSLERRSKADFDSLLSELHAVEGINAEIGEEMPAESLDRALEGMPAAADLLASEDDAPVIRLINSLIAEAVKNAASDVHLEPFENRLSVRLRVDGVLTEVASLAARMTPYIVSRIKVMARLDIAEKRIPQDGRISLKLGTREFDVRVSTLPARHGERVVLRLLDASQAQFSLEELGMQPSIHAGIQDLLSEPNGIILVTGPTGSGKTTTLYAGLGILNDQSRNIMTVEDPVEYALDGVSQTQVNAKVGMTFASGLRAILRQDPDVVMVGEIRDMETAEMAIQASLTGHLVLSTVHTNSSIAAITRLRDMGVEPFLLASTVKGILAQRLVRKLCDSCKRPAANAMELKAELGVTDNEDARLMEAVGCPDCGGKGYRGRIGIYELATIDANLRRMIQENTSEQDMEDYAFQSSSTLADSGRALVLKGVTTTEEVLRVSRIKETAGAGV
ncbi:MAG: type II secretion system ATPase GspE [Kordiimonadaceae bacterium]|nr:type II secretion system ATPase GspE [Kordiimonadaceae bacterium]MBO6568093.1 type II secretion system ATPase GspE [Kordiimonadaceae bacterium]MBO6964177.1 type II secretion system ATPase GspE [Kordiimonadaceae bacterium]